jgi:hypothetical protein
LRLDDAPIDFLHRGCARCMTTSGAVIRMTSRFPAASTSLIWWATFTNLPTSVVLHHAIATSTAGRITRRSQWWLT